MMQRTFIVGDVVRHRILGNEKVVVGIQGDRCLCVYREDIQKNGRLRPQARVAIHRLESLAKIGHYGTVAAISLTELCEEEYKQVHRLRRKIRLKEDVLPYSLFILAGILILCAILSGVESARDRIEAFFSGGFIRRN